MALVRLLLFKLLVGHSFYFYLLYFVYFNCKLLASNFYLTSSEIIINHASLGVKAQISVLKAYLYRSVCAVQYLSSGILFKVQRERRVFVFVGVF